MDLASLWETRKILYENLINCGYDEMWLQKKLVSLDFEKPENVFLATVDRDGNLSVYGKYEMKNKHDFFE